MVPFPFGVNGTLSERGMKWIRNGEVMSMMSPHPNVHCAYHFHGTFRVSKGAKVQYNDNVKFRHNLGSGGDATVYFSGSVWFRGPKPS